MYVTKTNSTNTLLSERLQTENLPDGYTVYTYHQTQGRGQRGNTWESEPGQNLLFSTLIVPNHLQASKQFIISQIVALALKKVLDTYTQGISIKWPNDIYWNDKKIAGILIENTLAGAEVVSSIIGVGLNVNQLQFVSNAPNPVSLAQITGRSYNQKTILTEIRHALDELKISMYSEPQFIAQNYMLALYRAANFYTYQTATETFEARIADVQSDGKLILELPNGEQRGFYFKEVGFVL